MKTNSSTELLIELHDGLPRLGPGNADSTLRALALCDPLPAAPDILDIGCGTGAQTLVLATALDGHITATDICDRFLARLQATILHQGLSSRIQTLAADMNRLPFPDRAFDLIWSEGAIYNIGFDNGLTAWRRLARPGAFLVVSELSWFSPNPPAELREFWTKHYPAMRSVEENIAAARAIGWHAVGNFHLPAQAWTDDYYRPLAQRIPVFRETHRDDNHAQEIADVTVVEMSWMDKYPSSYGYEFYVLRRGIRVATAGIAADDRANSRGIRTGPARSTAGGARSS